MVSSKTLKKSLESHCITIIIMGSPSRIQNHIGSILQRFLAPTYRPKRRGLHTSMETKQALIFTRTNILHRHGNLMDRMVKNFSWFCYFFNPNLKLVIGCSSSLNNRVRSQGRSYHGWFLSSWYVMCVMFDAVTCQTTLLCWFYSPFFKILFLKKTHGHILNIWNSPPPPTIL